MQLTIEQLNAKLSGLADIFCQEQLSGTHVEETEAVREFRTWLEMLYEVGQMGQEQKPQ